MIDYIFDGSVRLILITTPSIIQNMAQQKKIVKVSITKEQYPNHLLKITQTLEKAFQKHEVLIGSQYTLSQYIIEQSQDEIRSLKSLKSFGKQIDIYLLQLQRLLVRQLESSLDEILGEIFDEDLDTPSKINGYSCLVIIFSLLKIESIKRENSNKVLKWIYDITCITSMDLSLQLSNLIKSIKKKVIKLGFSVLHRIKNEKEGGEEAGDEEQFKKAVSNLIKSKEDEISGLKYEICRVCQKYIPMTSISAHIKRCEKVYQIHYLGSKLLSNINQLPAHSEEKYNLKLFFDKIYIAIGEVYLTFNLKNRSENIQAILNQDKTLLANETCDQILQLLESYLQCLNINADGDNLSEKESKIKSKFKIRVSKCGSNTSLIPSLQTFEQNFASEQTLSKEPASQRTINIEMQGMNGYSSLKLVDFQVLLPIGKGSYSEVFLVRKLNTKDLFAMKIIQIEHLNEERIHAFKQEQKIYKSITGDFNVKLYYSFSISNLYFIILDYGCGGSLRQLLEKEVYLEEKYIKTYMANLILAVDSIHKMGIVHRDLKPDNIVINELGHLILTDFNLSKLIIDGENEKPHTFFGTPDYIAPQVLREQPTNQMIDYFSLGIIAYQMVIGVTPFTNDTPQAVFQSIIEGNIQWPQVGNQQGQITSKCKSLLQGLLNPNPKQRLGASGLSQIQNHPFFEGINWSNLSQNQFFYIPDETPTYRENPQLIKYIQNKMKYESERAIKEDFVVRYDILKSITNKNVRERRSSRVKLQKQLQALKILPSTQKLKLRKHCSFNNFQNNSEDNIEISCKHLYLHPTLSSSQYHP